MAHTANSINRTLAERDLPTLTRDSLAALSAVCRDRFVAALERCPPASDPPSADRDFLQRVLRAAAPATQETLAAAGLQLAPEAVLRLAIERPTRLFSALNILQQPGHPKREVVIAALASVAIPVQEPAPAAPPPVPAPIVTPTQEPPKVFRSEHVYGANHAMCWNAIRGKDGVPGIMVDAARSAATGYDWPAAAHLWLSIAEVMRVYAVLRHATPQCEFSGHGSRHNKSFSLEWQKQFLYCRVADGATLYGVRITRQDATRLAVLCFEQMIQAYPNMPPAELGQLALSMAAPM